MSLLEVILAIAILAMALAVLAELVRIGSRASSSARDLTQAQLLCDSIMTEVVVGAIPPDPVSGVEVPPDAEWLYSIKLEPTDDEELVALRVTVVQNQEARKRPTQFSLVRWIPDPGIEIPEDEELATPSASDDDTSSRGESVEEEEGDQNSNER
jgi:type II secretion system protein I